MTGNLSLLTSTKQPSYPTKITLPNGHTSTISCSGHVHLTPTLTLFHVLHVPIFHHNLLSIPKLAQDTDSHIIFSSDSCYLLPKHSTTPLLFGKLYNGLYYFLPPASSHLNTALTIPPHVPSLPIPSSAHLWHCRLGHAPFAKLSHIPDIPHTPIGTCLTCPLAKFTKLPYPSSTSRAPDLFHLIHLDIWGPYKTPSRGHHNYFLHLLMTTLVPHGFLFSNLSPRLSTSSKNLSTWPRLGLAGLLKSFVQTMH